MVVEPMDRFTALLMTNECGDQLKVTLPYLQTRTLHCWVRKERVTLSLWTGQFSERSRDRTSSWTP